MNREDVIKIALEHGFMLSTAYGQKANKLMPISDTSTIEAFAQAIRAATKEEDAKICEDERVDAEETRSKADEAYNLALSHAGAAIRKSK